MFFSLSQLTNVSAIWFPLVVYICVALKFIKFANLINFKATQIYTTNGNQIAETFVNWDKEKNKCIAGFVLSGSIDGVEKVKITVSGEVLNFLSTGIDTRVYFIKNF